MYIFQSISSSDTVFKMILRVYVGSVYVISEFVIWTYYKRDRINVFYMIPWIASQNFNFLFKNILSILPKISSCWVQDIYYCRHIIKSFYEQNSISRFIVMAHIICIFDELPQYHFLFKHFTISFAYSSFSNYTAL